MTGPKSIEDAALGRTLAETAAINAPSHRSGLGAADSVRRATRGRAGLAARQRRFRRALLWLVLALALSAGLAAILQAVGL